ncbi:hypothetical protein F2Q69_00041026, partial [Brassica cretica]
MPGSCFNPFRRSLRSKFPPEPSFPALSANQSSSKTNRYAESETMEKKRFDSMESWSMILESENVETWEASKGEREEWTADLSQLFIGNKFASGAHSRIYRGIYKQRAVAVKMVRIPTHKEETKAKLEQQFKSEVALLSRLFHPNIVQFIAACKKPPAYCIITEYMSQGNLRMYLNKKEPYSLSIETVLRLALDISRGMEYLHSQGVIHRDLKSNNMLLNDEMRNERPPLPASCQPALAHLIKRCWSENPSKRPDFSNIVAVLEKYDECVKEGLPLTSHASLTKTKNAILDRLKGCVSAINRIHACFYSKHTQNISYAEILTNLPEDSFEYVGNSEGGLSKDDYQNHVGPCILAKL